MKLLRFLWRSKSGGQARGRGGDQVRTLQPISDGCQASNRHSTEGSHCPSSSGLPTRSLESIESSLTLGDLSEIDRRAQAVRDFMGNPCEEEVGQLSPMARLAIVDVPRLVTELRRRIEGEVGS